MVVKYVLSTGRSIYIVIILFIPREALISALWLANCHELMRYPKSTKKILHLYFKPIEYSSLVKSTVVSPVARYWNFLLSQPNQSNSNPIKEI